ncbi:MAG: DNA polymerase III subunit beta, partial [Nitrospinota bacterium]|nr:DNA polymerase III subunit beta [Nitrospinota bacterium]
DCKLFLHALRRVAILADEKSRMVKFGVQKNLMILVSDNSELGEAKEEIDVEYQGTPITIGLNAKYVMDILNVINSEKINFKLKDSESSCLITPAENENYRCIVMPMRI